MNKKILFSYHLLLFLIFYSIFYSSCSQTKEKPISTQTKTYTLSIYISPIEGGRVILNPQGGVYTEGTVVNLEAVANSGYVFDRWEGSITGRQNPTTIVMNSDKVVYAYFLTSSTASQTYYTLSVSVSPEGSGEVSITPFLDNYLEGTEVQIIATPKEGYIFSSWSGDITTTQNPITIVMNSNKNIVANFVEKPSGGEDGGDGGGGNGSIVIYRLTVDINPQGAGEVNLNPVGGEYVAGTEVTLTASANSGYVFSNWSGDITGTDNPITIVMDSDKNVTANFVQGYILTFSINPENGGTIIFSPEGTSIAQNQLVYPPGTSVQLTAVSNPGYVFHQWLGGIGAPFQINRSNPITLIMNRDITIAAVFVSE